MPALGDLRQLQQSYNGFTTYPVNNSMTIVFYHYDGTHRVLRPKKALTPDMIRDLAWDFKAREWKVK